MRHTITSSDTLIILTKMQNSIKFDRCIIINLRKGKVISVSELKIGDYICNDSYVVMIVDIVENDKGEKCYLIGQSFIPAVCFHIVINRQGDDASAWFTQKQLEQDSFEVGVYSFDKSNIRRWKDGF